jgi:hypothetical protein
MKVGRIATKRGRAIAVMAMLLAVVLSFAVGPARAKESEPAKDAKDAKDAPHEVAIVGEVVETACWVMAARRGESHRACAIASARAGQDLGLLDDKGNLYLVVRDLTARAEPNPLRDVIAERVEIRGTLIERGGARAILARHVHSLSEPKKTP